MESPSSSAAASKVVEGLFRAIAAKNAAVVQQMLEAHPELDLSDIRKDGKSSFHYACEVGALPVVQALLEFSDYLIDSTNDAGEVPLHVAVANDKAEVVAFLLENGVDINEATTNASVYEGYTALHFCAQTNLKNMALLLLEAPGVDINATTPKGETPVHVAALQGSVEVMAALIKKGCNTSVKTLLGSTPLSLASSRTQLKCMFALIKAAPDSLNQTDLNEDTPLHLALQSQCHRLFNYNYPTKPIHLEAAFLLLKSGADVTRKNKDGDLALDLVHPLLAKICEAIAASPASFKSYTSIYTLMEASEEEMAQAGVHPSATKSILELSQLYLDEQAQIAQLQANRPPCTVIDTSRPAYLRKFAHMNAVNPALTEVERTTTTKCPLGYTKEDAKQNGFAAFFAPPMPQSAIPLKARFLRTLRTPEFWIWTCASLAAAAAISAKIISTQRRKQSVV